MEAASSTMRLPIRFALAIARPTMHPNQPPPEMPRFLTALPVFNESQHVTSVLDQVVKYATDVLVVDDGSTDGTGDLLSRRDDIDVVLHEQNRGYGAALQTAFEYAIVMRYDIVVTIDCDGQHEPQRISQLAQDCSTADILSGSRYLELDQPTDHVPTERRQINEIITAELNRRLGLKITDAFCGFKAYCTRALARLDLTETGYALPLELWVQAAKHKLRIREMPVPLIYLDEERSFGGALDAADRRLKYYREVIDRALRAAEHSAEQPSRPQPHPPRAQPCS